uniref:Uncharacterized protein n=1 Tax=Aegilops tauschii TaxID=37682 RepID=M8CDS7_AEGTA
MERPDSEFKERLMCVLRKPFSQGEYDMLLGNARIRLPATKKRQTRSGVKYYDSTHERVQSYFDCHPGGQVGGPMFPVLAVVTFLAQFSLC